MRRIIFLEGQAQAFRTMLIRNKNIEDNEEQDAKRMQRYRTNLANNGTKTLNNLDKHKDNFMTQMNHKKAETKKYESLATERNAKANPKYISNTSKIIDPTLITPSVSLNSSVEPDTKSFDKLILEAAEDYGKKEREKQNSQDNAVYYDSLLFNDEGGKLLKDIINNTHDSENSESKVILSYIESNILAKNVLSKLRALLKKPKFDTKKAQEYKAILKGYIAEAKKGE